MAYATAADLIARYGDAELAQASRDGSESGVYDAVAVARAITDADAEIDSYLSVRYDTPITSPPAIVTAASCKLARLNLHTEQSTEIMRTDAADARAWLKSISTGKAGLPGVSLSDSSVAPVAVVLASDQVFTDDLLSVMP